jgi:hypothetical protein
LTFVTFDTPHDVGHLRILEQSQSQIPTLARGGSGFTLTHALLFRLVQIIKDRDTGRPKGYGFVMFENSEDARDAIYGLDQKVAIKKHERNPPLNLST